MARKDEELKGSPWSVGDDTLKVGEGTAWH